MEAERNNAKDLLISIGETLKAAREGKGLAIDQVQKQTHIHSTVLRALEEGRCDEILTPTYARSFLKKYSAYLEIDSKDMLREYSSLHAEEPGLKMTLLDKPEVRDSRLASKVIYGLSTTLLLVAFISLLVFLGKKATPAFKPKKTQKARAVSSSPKPRPALAPKAAPQALSIPKKSPFKLTLKVKRRVLVEVKRDGVLLFNRSLPKGTVETLTANDKIELSVAKAEAIELVLNGKSLGSPGKGVVKNLEVTSQGIRVK